MATIEATYVHDDDTEPTDLVDDFLRLIAHVRDEKPRDPLRRLEDVLLDLRVKAGA